MSTQLLVFGAIALLAIGFTAGALIAITLGARLISDHVSGRLAKRQQRAGPDEFEAGEVSDEDDRLDALAIRDLIRAARGMTVDNTESGDYRLGGLTELHKAADAAQERFAHWIEWVGGASDTVTTLGATEAGA